MLLLIVLPHYFCELIEQHKSSTNTRTRLANDAFLLKLPHSVVIVLTPFLIVPSLMEKQGLDPEILKNYRPVANLSFISKIIGKAIATQIHDHLINNDIVDNFQSAYKAGHSCETALLRVYNDIVTTIGAMLVLLDLSAAFDTIQLIMIIFLYS